MYMINKVFFDYHALLIGIWKQDNKMIWRDILL